METHWLEELKAILASPDALEREKLYADKYGIQIQAPVLDFGYVDMALEPNSISLNSK